MVLEVLNPNLLKTCDNCGGSGQVVNVMRTVFGNIQQAAPCPKCRATGKIPEKTCSVCRGKGTERPSVLPAIWILCHWATASGSMTRSARMSATGGYMGAAPAR